MSIAEGFLKPKKRTIRKSTLAQSIAQGLPKKRVYATKSLTPVGNKSAIMARNATAGRRKAVTGGVGGGNPYTRTVRASAPKPMTVGVGTKKKRTR
jgi:hypothetical protein